MVLLGVGERSRASAQSWEQAVHTRLVVSDVFVVAIILVVAHAVRFDWDPFVRALGPSAPASGWITAAIGVLWLLQLGWVRSRDTRILGTGPVEYQRVGTAGLRTFAIVGVVGFLSQWDLSRSYLVFALPLGTLVLFGYRRLWRQWLNEQRGLGRLRRAVVVAGPRRTCEQIIRRLDHAEAQGYDVVGVCLAGESGDDAPAGSGADDPGRAGEAPGHRPLTGELLCGVPVLGDIARAPTLAAGHGAGYVVLAGTEHVSLREARRLEWALEEAGVGLIVAPTLVDCVVPRVAVSEVVGLPLMHVDPPRFSGASRVLKGLGDRLAAAAALLLLAAPFAVIAVAVKLSSPGPVLFRQERVGRDHARFEMLKFRTMFVDAEHRLEVLRDSARAEGNEVLFKMRDDPRVTRVGRVLRRFSLDELPQLVNVLVGEMSIVGPRPPLPSEVELWDEDVSRRQLVKPGITGLWQVSGRSNLPWDESVRLDLHYTQNWSLGLDMLILLRTLWAVLSGRGAY
ncbi:sugar transferase [Demequina pelophila]|uniref:sugar transferase n=1 Tax=Demequina pelophila TaxID=1638984 RepID=UPI0009E50762|nr:sugar transferase [Demequina pelophila]